MPSSHRWNEKAAFRCGAVTQLQSQSNAAAFFNHSEVAGHRDIPDTYLTFRNVHSALYWRQGDPQARLNQAKDKKDSSSEQFSSLINEQKYIAAYSVTRHWWAEGVNGVNVVENCEYFKRKKMIHSITIATINKGDIPSKGNVSAANSACL